MIQWITETDLMPEEPKFEIRKVAGPEQSLIDLFDLINSREKIGQKIFETKDLETGEKLTAIYRDLNVIINRSL